MPKDFAPGLKTAKERKRERSRKWKRDHPEYNKKWYQENKSAVTKRMKKYRRKNKLKIKKYQHNWEIKNAARLDVYKRAYRRGSGFKWSQYQLRASRKGLSFKLTREQFDWLIIQPCAYCGEPGGGVDRIDNKFGYESGNCQPCCRWCNYSKRDRTHEEFMSWVKKISTHSVLK